jgi:hypothetical protein
MFFLEEAYTQQGRAHNRGGGGGGGGGPPPPPRPPPPLAAPPPPPREETTDTLDRSSTILPLLCHTPGTLYTASQKGVYSPRSSPLGGRLRTISADTAVRIGHVEVPSSDHGDRSSKKRPAEPRCSLRHLSDHREVFLMAPRVVPEAQLVGCSEPGRKDRINLNILFERTQGHFLSPCSRHGSLCTKPPR